MRAAIDADIRRYAATLIRRHFEGSVTPEALVERLGDSEDPLIHASLDIVAHRPRRGFTGVSDRHWNSVYWPRVERLLIELEKGATGIAPKSPLYPAGGPLRLLGLLFLTAFSLASAVQHVTKVWKHINGAQPLGDRRLLVELCASIVLGACAVAAAGALADRLRGRRQSSSEGTGDAP